MADEAASSAPYPTYYLIISRPATPAPAGPLHHQENMAWLAKLREQEIVVSSGPTSDRSGSIFLIVADDEEEARKIAATSPYSEFGERENEVIAWEVHYARPHARPA